MEIREAINTADAYRASLVLKNREALFIDVPNARFSPRYFSIFWFGNPTFENLTAFLGDCFDFGHDWLSSMFFFARDKVRLKAEPVKHIPSQREVEVLQRLSKPPDYRPRFVRYEVYDGDPAELKLPEEMVSFRARFVNWAALATSEQVLRDSEIQNEVGVYLNLGSMDKLKGPIGRLVHLTIGETMGSEEVPRALQKLVDVVGFRIKNRWPAALT